MHVFINAMAVFFNVMANLWFVWYTARVQERAYKILLVPLHCFLSFTYSETRIIARDSHLLFWNSDYRQRFPLKSTGIWRYRKQPFGVLKFSLECWTNILFFCKLLLLCQICHACTYKYINIYIWWWMLLSSLSRLEEKCIRCVWNSPVSVSDLALQSQWRCLRCLSFLQVMKNWKHACRSNIISKSSYPLQ